MAADEGKFGRMGEVRSCWCPKGIRPTVAKHQVRQYVYAYAAVAPSLGKMSCLVLPYANTKMMNLFLQQVSVEFADYFLVMQLDKAAWGPTHVPWIAISNITIQMQRTVESR